MEHEDGRLELYDLSKDIGERNNLAKELPEKAEELHAMLKKWRAELNCPVPTQLNPKFSPRKIKKNTAKSKSQI